MALMQLMFDGSCPSHPLCFNRCPASLLDLLSFHILILLALPWYSVSRHS